MKSMTGYGSAEGKVGSGRVFVEIKSVNHRYCDITAKIPPKMNSLDPLIRKLLKQNIERGKVELFLKERKGIASAKGLSVDLDLAKKYEDCLKKIKKAFPGNRDIGLLDVFDITDLIMIDEARVDYSRHWTSIKIIAGQAILKFNRMRSAEGAYLLKDQRLRLKKIAALVERVERQSRVSIENFQARLKKRLSNGVGFHSASKERVDSELASLAEKLDIAEEITRLKSHIRQYGALLGKNGAKGRQLDFLLQEMNREINTLGAKSGDAKISSDVVFVKSELEKLREQVQNIE